MNNIKAIIKKKNVNNDNKQTRILNGNSIILNEDIKKYCKLNTDSMNLLRQAVTQMHLSARGYHRILKLSRTIADLDDDEDIKTSHIAEALQYRTKIN